MIENLTVGVYMDEKLEQAMRTTEPTFSAHWKPVLPSERRHLTTLLLSY